MLLKNYIYTCKDCGHTFNDAKPEAYKDVHCKIPCSKCKGVVECAEKELTLFKPSVGPSIGDPISLGIRKHDQRFIQHMKGVKKFYKADHIKDY